MEAILFHLGKAEIIFLTASTVKSALELAVLVKS
jgi:hypothetical protein